jgi:hypothetical protein
MRIIAQPGRSLNGSLQAREKRYGYREKFFSDEDEQG